MDRDSPGTGPSGCKLGPARALSGVPGRSACGYSAGTGPFGQKKRRRLFRRRQWTEYSQIINLLSVVDAEYDNLLSHIVIER